MDHGRWQAGGGELRQQLAQQRRRRRVGRGLRREGNGGAIDNECSNNGYYLTITNSTVAGNAANRGGAIWLAADWGVTIGNSTVAALVAVRRTARRIRVLLPPSCLGRVRDTVVPEVTREAP